MSPNHTITPVADIMSTHYVYLAPLYFTKWLVTLAIFRKQRATKNSKSNEGRQAKNGGDKARRGSGFYEIFCIFANMSCLCIHLVTLFNLPCKNILSWNKLFYVIKLRFCGMLHHPKVFISVK